MGKFKFSETRVPGMWVIEPTRFGDSRGYFMETYHKEEFAAAGISTEFVQDNQSKSSRGVLRGLHFQRQHTQAKLVRVVKGLVFDVGVDLRPGSPSFGRWAAAELSEENGLQLYVPEGFAHGFLVLSDTAEFCYKCGDIYHPASEGGVRWNDPDIGIAWPDTASPPLLSEKDAALPLLRDLGPEGLKCFERWAKP